MKPVIFTGSGVALITPFRDNKVDFDKLRDLCNFHIKAGTDALVICGTTGEASTMPDEEHLSVIEHAVKYVNKSIPVIAGAGSNDTAHAIELSVESQNLGADGILSVTPYYNKASQEGLYRHFKGIADSVDIPVILYNVPSRTSVNIEPKTYARLSEVDNIVAIKECNFSQVSETVNLCGDKISIYSGEDALVLPMLAYGGRGVISVVGNIVPKQTHDLVHSFLRGDIEKSRQIQVSLVPLIKAIFSDVNPIPVKSAMNYLGYDVGEPRMPLCEMSPESYKALVNVIDSYDIDRWK